MDMEMRIAIIPPLSSYTSSKNSVFGLPSYFQGIIKNEQNI